MTKIFVSYRRDDSADQAYSIVTHLTEVARAFSADDIFFDVDSIPMGVNVRKHINERVSQCVVMLVIIGTDWATITDEEGTPRLHISGDYVRLEVEAALSRGIPLIPVLVRGAKIPKAADLPGSLRDLPDYNGVSVRRAPDFRADMARLITELDRIVKTPAAPVGAHRDAPVDMPLVPPAAAPAKIARPSSLDLFKGTPFAWIDIPGTIGKNWTGDPYQIAKYPVTNAQFKLFIDAGGYKERKWWTDAGWEARAQGWEWQDFELKPSGKAWTEPRYWGDSRWNGAEQPVVGVSWFEAVAFCLWLSDVTGDNIMLPTEDQWQYAAQGDDGRAYPWGETWDAKRCNNNVDNKGVGKTTPVRQYEGKGDSPFGVVDMAGNVWEWCATDCERKSNDINMSSQYRVLRGGSWLVNVAGFFRCDFRYGGSPHVGDDFIGFRVVRS